MKRFVCLSFIVPLAVATLPANFLTAAQRSSRVTEPPQHWAYRAPTNPSLPQVSDAQWPRNAVDSFVLARLEAKKWKPSPAADPYSLVRRLYMDVIGFIPSPEAADEFVHDTAPDAYERLVDRLLASAEFGVKWARPWLDLARYADSHGFQRDDLRDIWPYRDWVIQALNTDKPFDQFTIEQLAGDLLPQADLSQRIATGFNRCATANVEAGTDQEQGRVNQVFDRVNTLGAVWLGTTLECAQCHDHKYDPFSQQEYYQLFAFFNNTPLETDFANPKAMASLKFTGPYLDLSTPAVKVKRNEFRERIKTLKKQSASLKSQLKSPETTVETVDNHTSTSNKLQQIRAELEQLNKQLSDLDSPRTLVMKELPDPRETAVLKRGDFLNRGDLVQPGVPKTLPPAQHAPRTRLDLAQWIVDRDNPLVARVVVNRWWAELFGHGIVSTQEDFGVKGEPPTHPLLLDWLAVKLMDSGWSMKTVLRTILTSATYRQSSRLTPESLQRDDRNQWYARGPRFRVDAEMIRDNALSAAGLLSTKLGGPPVYPFQPAGLWTKVGGDPVKYERSAGEDSYRRGLYTIWKRGSPYPSFINFDAPPRTACVVNRSRSNTPLQALTLLNDPVYVEAAQALAARAVREQRTDDIHQWVRRVFRLCLVRPPDPAEIQVLTRLYQDSLKSTQATEECTTRLNLSLLADLENRVSPEQFAALVEVAATTINLDETITKN